MERCLYLKRWTGPIKRYCIKYFVLSLDGILSYYDTKAAYDETVNQGQLGKGQGELRVENCNLVYNSESLEFLIVERNTNTEMDLRALTEEDRQSWTQAIQERGAHVMTMEQYRDLVYFGRLIPQLSFPTCEEERLIRSYQQSDQKLLNGVGSTIWASLSTTVGIIIPGGSIITEIIGMGIPKIFEFFQQCMKSHSKALKDLEQKLNLVIDAKLLHMEVVRVSAMLIGAESRIMQMLSSDSTLNQKQMEVPVLMQTCQEILILFSSSDHVFSQHPLVMGPHPVQFAYFFLWISQLVCVSNTNYNQVLEMLLRKLMHSVNDYKTRGIEQRLAAVVQKNESKRAKAITISKGIALAPAWPFIDPQKYRFANEKAEDALYPSKGIGTNYQYDVEYSVGFILLDKYKQILKNKYEQYFQDVIVEISDMIKVLEQLEDTKVLELELQNWSFLND